ncbi:MAG: ribonuclease R [Patescibacteria group bacterium]
MIDSFSGTIRTTNRQTGYVSIPDTDRFVEISGADLNTALNNDTVRVVITSKQEHARDDLGRVVKVLKRSKTKFVGQIKYLWNEEKKKKAPQFIADGRGFYPNNPYISNLQSFDDLEGKKIVLELESWDDPARDPKMRIDQILGDVGDNEAEMQAVVIDRGLVLGFEPEIEELAAQYKKGFKETFDKELVRRRDMRDRTMFTIDPADAKDFDDALSVHKLDNGNYEIGIHIADPSFFVEEGSRLDEAAYERATSIYLVDRTIPMLPEVLSNDLCSLNPKEEKLTFSAVFEMSPKAEIVSRWFGETVTVSDYRFTYQDAQDILDAGNGAYYTELSILSDIAKILQKQKIAGGAIEFESKEVKFELDSKLFPIRVIPKERLWTMEIIEECMLLANREVSRFVSLDEHGQANSRPFIYRVHDKPKQEKIMEAVSYLRTIGFEVDSDGDGNITSGEINRILKEHRDSPLEDLISMTLLRAMNKATYSTKNIGHYGLGFAYYSHFTSPIRRYPDVIAHRLLRRYLSGEDVPESERAYIQKQAEHSSDMELRAVEAERESIKFKYTQLFSTMIGQEVDAVIFKVMKFGLLIEEKETRGEGMINVRNMGGDYFEFDEKHMILIGRNNGNKFQVGDKIRARVINADIEKKQIDFELIS